MSREIKFRAWISSDSKIAQVAKLEFVRDVEVVVWVGRRVGGESIFRLHPSKLMQFTGLQDKNGKDIYEGDVVLCPSGTLSDIRDVEIEGEVYKAYKPNPPIQYVISNMGYAFFLGTLEKPDYAGVLNHQHNKMHYDLEVIGNIYENPELLEK